jgi:hypothetical protein
VDLDDVLDPRAAAAVAVTAVLFSSRVRRIARRGTIYGVAGLLATGEFARNIPRWVQQKADREGDELQDIIAAPATDEPGS